MDKPKSTKKTPSKKNWIKNTGFVLILLVIGLIFLLSYKQPAKLTEKSFNDVMNRANSGEVTKLNVKGSVIEVTPKGSDKATEKTRKESNATLYGQGGLTNRDVEVTFKEASSSSATWTALAINLLPVIIIVGVLVFMLRSAQGQGNQAMGFGKSSARLYGNEKEVVKFKDVAGNDEAKVDLEEVVEFLKFPKKFEAVGAKIPKGVY